MRSAMFKFSAGLGALILGLMAAPAAAQTGSHHLPTPPQALDKQSQTKEPPAAPAHQVDPAQLQKDADDLARVAQTIPVDVASVRKGMLPKDVIEKLKQIEKLSKRLRTELNP